VAQNGADWLIAIMMNISQQQRFLARNANQLEHGRCWHASQRGSISGRNTKNPQYSVQLWRLYCSPPARTKDTGTSQPTHSTLQSRMHCIISGPPPLFLSMANCARLSESAHNHPQKLGTTMSLSIDAALHWTTLNRKEVVAKLLPPIPAARSAAE